MDARQVKMDAKFGWTPSSVTINKANSKQKSIHDKIIPTSDQHQTGNSPLVKNSVNSMDIKEDKNSDTSITVAGYLTVKHPLMYRWSLWYCKQDKSRSWEDCMKEVASFNTVEDFWA
uniref:Uncharacterized protein n=1 Tax=Romanomermis culicivorax TaxID=13658 RepID=A0A915JFA6_ROMCU